MLARGEVFSEVVTRNYGRADLTLLDFVKAANPEVASIDLIHVGQRIKLPAFEPGALVQKTGDSQYRLHVMTVSDVQGQGMQKLRSLVAKLGRQIYVVPVTLTQRGPAYRLLVGDFANPGGAEAFYREVRVPTPVSGQLWR